MTDMCMDTKEKKKTSIWVPSVFTYQHIVILIP